MYARIRIGISRHPIFAKTRRSMSGADEMAGRVTSRGHDSTATPHDRYCTVLLKHCRPARWAQNASPYPGSPFESRSNVAHSSYAAKLIGQASDRVADTDADVGKRSQFVE